MTADLEQLIALAEKIENPVWDYVKDLPNDDLLGYGSVGFTPINYSVDDNPNGTTKFTSHRDRIVTRYAWAIPSPESLAFMVGILDGRSVVEIGAGSGYWAWMLSQMGVDVNAYDRAPIGYPSSWFNMEKLELRLRNQEDVDKTPLLEFHPVLPGEEKEVLKQENQGRVLFLCWPTMDSWAYETARLFEGDTIIHIGEGPGGCTGDSKLFKFLDEGCGCWSGDCECKDIQPEFEAIATGPLVQWAGLHDYITVYQRKTR